MRSVALSTWSEWSGGLRTSSLSVSVVDPAQPWRDQTALFRRAHTLTRDPREMSCRGSDMHDLQSACWSLSSSFYLRQASASSFLCRALFVSLDTAICSFSWHVEVEHTVRTVCVSRRMAYEARKGVYPQDGPHQCFVSVGVWAGQAARNVVCTV